MNTTEKFVTVSDEAFALILYKNYNDKWITSTTTQQLMVKEETKFWQKIKPMLDTLNIGWSEKGVIWFNQLCQIAVEDRCSQSKCKISGRTGDAKSNTHEILIAGT